MLTKSVRLASLLVAFTAAGTIVPGCSTAPTTPEGKETLNQNSTISLADLKNADPSLDQFMNGSYGYAIFPSVGKGGAGVGGAYGRGEVFEQGKKIGFADLTQGSVGLQLGGQTYAEVIVFENKEALEKFKSNRMELAANASAVALKSGAAASAKYDNGVVVFVKPTEGLMAEVSIGGQQFSYQAGQ